MLKVLIKNNGTKRKCFAFPISNGIRKNRVRIISAFFALALPILSLAAGDGSGTIVNPIKSQTIMELIRKILEGVVKIGLPIVVLAIIYCGFLFVKARGNSDELKKAKSALVSTLIGAAILLGSWAIAELITDTVKAL